MKKIKALLFSAYILVVLWITLLGRRTSCAINMLCSPFWEYKRLLIDGQITMLHDILLNMAMFVPFGFLFPLVKNDKIIITIAFAVMFSSAIELGQLVLNRGWCEIDDVFNNTVGAYIGFIIFKALIRRKVDK